MKTYQPAPSKGFIWGIALVIFIGVVLAVSFGISLAAGRAVPGFLAVMGLVFLVVVPTITYFTWAAKNMTYGLGDDGITIKWAFSKKTIPLESILGVDRTVGSSSIKVVGASWPGFHLGAFSNPLGKGSVNMFATRLWGEILLIQTKWEIVGITPAEPDEFLKDLNHRKPGLQPASLTGGPTLETFSPWKQKSFLGLVAISVLLITVTGIFLHKTIPTLPSRVPMHFNISGQVDRYGSPSELYMLFGIGVLITGLMLVLGTLTARNNKTSAYLMAFVAIFISLIFCLITISMALSV